MANEPTQVAPETGTEPAPTPAPAPTLVDVLARLDALQQENQRLAQAIVAQQTPVIAPMPATTTNGGDLTDDQLWALAQQGNRQAFELYQERIADRRFSTRFREEQQTASTRGQLAAAYAQYPELRDPQHPLTQRAMAFKNALIATGEPATSLKTDLDAILRAVADSRGLLAPRATPAGVRSVSAGQIPATPSPTSRPDTPAPVTAAEAALAKRMGIKDPAAARKRFEERQRDGRSSVSPLIAAAVKEGA